MPPAIRHTDLLRQMMSAGELGGWTGVGVPFALEAKVELETGPLSVEVEDEVCDGCDSDNDSDSDCWAACASPVPAAGCLAFFLFLAMLGE